MRKDYSVNFTPNTWIHFLFRMTQPLMGADMYTDFYIDGQHIAEIGINGEQHWYQFTNCVPKTFDDEFFIGLLIRPTTRPNFISPDTSGWLNDIRVPYPAGYAKPYTEWTAFSLKYEDTQDGTPGARRLRLFVDGREIMYRGLDFAPGTGFIDNSTPFVPGPGPNTVTVSFGVFSDGDEYNTTDPQGIRYRRCFAQYTPAVPCWVGSCTEVALQSATMQWGWLVIGNGRASTDIQSGVTALMYQGRLPSTAFAVQSEMLPWWVAEANCPFVSSEEISAVRGHWLGSPIWCPGQ
jgi:hypothetical protein